MSPAEPLARCPVARDPQPLLEEITLHLETLLSSFPESREPLWGDGRGAGPGGWDLPSFTVLCLAPQDGDGRMDAEFGSWPVQDSAQISVQPHIRVGSCFQAELPELRDRSQLDQEVEAATLVWKPWGDIATNPETQTRVRDFLRVASSSTTPGGGTNLELALHCLHQTQGNVLEALEMVQAGPLPRSESHPLADYRYTGSDPWTLLEKELFKEAFSEHKKDFGMIQKKVQTKTVAQCVEFYYTWKRKMRFVPCRTRKVVKRVKRDKEEVEEAEKQAGCSPRKRRCHLPPEEDVEMNWKDPKKLPQDPAPHAGFPCGECGRVFEKIRGRNIHMKRHHPLEETEPLLKVKWPRKHFPSQVEPQETQRQLGGDQEPLVLTSQ